MVLSFGFELLVRVAGGVQEWDPDVGPVDDLLRGVGLFISELDVGGVVEPRKMANQQVIVDGAKCAVLGEIFVN